MTSSPEVIGRSRSASSSWPFVMASRSRASTSAGPAVSSRTSSSAPLGRETSEAALGEDGQQGSADPGRAQHPAQGAGARQLPSRIDEDDVAVGRVDEGGRLGGQDAHRVAQQPEGRQHLGARGERVGEQQQSGHLMQDRRDWSPCGPDRINDETE